MDKLSFGKQGKVFAQKKRKHEVLPSRNLNHCLSEESALATQGEDNDKAIL